MPTLPAQEPETHSEPAPRPDPPEMPAPPPTPPALRQRPVSWRSLVAVAVLVAGLIGVGMVRRQEEAPLPAPKPSATISAGSLMLDLPRSVVAREFRTTLLRMGEIARSGNWVVDRLPPDELASIPLEPGVYVARFRYLNQALPDSVVQVKLEGTTVQPSRRDLAEAEYNAGIARDGRGNAGVAYFRRAVALNPSHVKAHLQLAAFELLSGSPRRVRQHLAAVRKVQPRNPDAKRVEALLRRRLAHAL